MTSRSAKQQRWLNYEMLLDSAISAGQIAAASATPRPMTVLNEDRTVADVVHDGEFGSCSITVSDGRHAFARWLKSTDRGYACIDGGVTLSVYERTGSMCRAVAHGNAIADTLKAAGIPIRLSPHMD